MFYRGYRRVPLSIESHRGHSTSQSYGLDPGFADVNQWTMYWIMQMIWSKRLVNGMVSKYFSLLHMSWFQNISLCLADPASTGSKYLPLVSSSMYHGFRMFLPAQLIHMAWFQNFGPWSADPDPQVQNTSLWLAHPACTALVSWSSIHSFKIIASGQLIHGLWVQNISPCSTDPYGMVSQYSALVSRSSIHRCRIYLFFSWSNVHRFKIFASGQLIHWPWVQDISPISADP